MKKNSKDRKKPSELVADADVLLDAGIDKREAYLKALPLMFEMREAAVCLKGFAKSLEERADALSEQTAAYAKEHVTALDEPLHEVSGGKECGSIAWKDDVFTLTLTKGPIKRASGDNMTADFLNGLPKSWIKNKPALDVQGINRLGVDDKELFDHGLLRSEKREWTRKLAAVAAGGVSDEVES